MTHRFVEIAWQDFQMDQKGNFNLPVNALPVACGHCTFPDLDFVAQPYFLAKGVRSSKEFDGAELGNFFVVDRVRKVLELVVPEACDFFPTHDLKTKDVTPWSLAVPRRQVRTADVKSEIPRCPECGQPKTAHWGTQCENFEEPILDDDIVKSANWVSYEVIGESAPWYWMHVLKVKTKPASPPQQWSRAMLHRFLYFSVRLDGLLKKLKIKGLLSRPVRPPKSFGESVQADDGDKGWIEEKFQLLTAAGLTGKAESEDSQKWLRAYLAKKGKAKKAALDFGEVEAKARIVLPESYKNFVCRARKRTFKNIDDQEGFDVEILLPENLEIECYRKGRTLHDEENKEFDGLMFAATGHGDCFCFNLAENPSNPPVYHYDHEIDSFELYTADFADCIRRFVEG